MFLLNSRLDHFTATSEQTEVPLLANLRGNFAEFLKCGYLACLKILFLITCVRCRYRHNDPELFRSFSWKYGVRCFTNFPKDFAIFYTSSILEADLPTPTFTCLDKYNQSLAHLNLLCHSITDHHGIGISTNFPSTTPFGLVLGPD